ncbi:MAG: hypothetical protein JKY03_07205, partial [Aureispira sp.]|nr:hypothetical protein [Aureispira sp.]
MTAIKIIFTTILLYSFGSLFGQGNSTIIRNGEHYGTTTINGHIVKILIIDGDTLPVADMESIQVTQKRNFTSREERKRYKQWRKYA